ncbi:MAG: cell division protein FtsQ/DivIB [Pseudomonadota bacterium]
MRSMMLDPTTRLGYRLQRIWLTPVLRALLRTGLPSLFVCIGIYSYVSQPEVRQLIAESVIEAKSWVHGRPEFVVRLMAIEGAAPEVAEAIRSASHLDLPKSSFDIDLEALRETIEGIPAVQTSTLRVRPGGVLEVSVVERTPAFVWRHREGISLLDVDGVEVASLISRMERPDLPLVVGAGADRAIPEALDLIRAASPIHERLRGLRRMGERRWDVVLDRGQVVKLPETGALPALERVILLDSAQELLGRNVTVVDLRNPRRPTLRVAQGSLEELRKIKGIELGVNVDE